MRFASLPLHVIERACPRHLRKEVLGELMEGLAEEGRRGPSRLNGQLFPLRTVMGAIPAVRWSSAAEGKRVRSVPKATRSRGANAAPAPGIARVRQEHMTLDVAGHYHRPDLFEFRTIRTGQRRVADD